MKTPFKLKSGNASAFKNLGSSPMKQGTQLFDVTDLSGSHMKDVPHIKGGEYVSTRERLDLAHESGMRKSKDKEIEEAMAYSKKHGRRKPTAWEKFKSDVKSTAKKKE